MRYVSLGSYVFTFTYFRFLLIFFFLGTISDFDQLLEFAKFGCYIQYDLFGTECSYYQLNSALDMPSDGHRINYLMKLIDEGLLERLLMSHDVHTKHRLVCLHIDT